MGTTATLDCYESDDGKTSWRLYEELFESGAVDLELTAQAQTRLVMRLPLDMAKRLATANVMTRSGEVGRTCHKIFRSIVDSRPSASSSVHTHSKDLL